jgi:amidophosphoribosyltransferase
MDDEIVVGASERPAIQRCSMCTSAKSELKPGHALIMKMNGSVEELPFLEPAERAACSFERIYFSRGNDREIYQERKKLGEQLAKPVLKACRF